MSEILGEALVVVRPDTTQFAAALEAQIAAITKQAITIPVVAAGAAGAAAAASATQAVAVAQKDAAVAGLGLESAEKLVNRQLAAGIPILGASTAATAEKAGADAAAANAARVHAVAAGRAEKAVIAQAAGQLGLRGAVLTSSTAFLAATVATVAFGKSIAAASDATEQLNKVNVVFGSSAKVVTDFAKTAAASFGLADTEALKAAGIFGNLFRSIGIGQKSAADMSVQLLKLASDLASFNNASPERTLEALRAGLVGQSRPLRVFGIFLSQARAQQQALIDTGKTNVKALTNAELVQARFNIILHDSVLAQGDFARTSERTANQARILRANFENLSANVGSKLLPVVNLLVQDFNDLFAAGQKLQNLKINIPVSIPGLDKLQELAGAGGGGGKQSIFGKIFNLTPLGAVIHPLGNIEEKLALIHAGLRLFIGDSKDSSFSAKDLADKLGELGSAAGTTAGQLATTVTQVEALKQATHAAAGVAAARVAAEAASPTGQLTPQAAIAADKADIAAQKKIAAAAHSGSKARNDALKQIAADKRDEATQRAQIASDAQAAAQKTKDAAAKAAQAQANATQAFIDAFGPKQQQLENQLTTAATNNQIGREIAINQRLVRFFQREIRLIQERIKQMHLHGDALKAARAAIAAAKQAIFTTQDQINQLTKDLATQRQQNIQAAIDAQAAHLDALITIAEAGPQGPAQEQRVKRALEAKIKFDTDQIARLKKIRHRTREQNAQLDAYRVDLAQQNEALRGITTEKQKGVTFQQEAFSFLQTQTGFTSNLIGNLIPAGASGLVGGKAGGVSPTGAVPKIPVPPREPPTPAGPTRGQGQTTNHLLQQAVALLRQIYLGQGHPEARRQAKVGNAVMDSGPWSPGGRM